MSRVRHDLITRIWRGRDPFLDHPPNVQEVDLGGWRGEHPYLAEAIASVTPRYVVEVGTGKGGSAIVMARELKARKIDGVVIAVDTFLGSLADWQADETFDALGFEAGGATLYGRFANNVLRFGLGNYILPLTMDAMTAASLLLFLDVHPGVVHIDASADYHSVTAMLNVWWNLLKPGGVLIGGNYHKAVIYPEVKRAYDDFFGVLKLPIEDREGKCRIVKTEATAQTTQGSTVAPLAAPAAAPASVAAEPAPAPVAAPAETSPAEPVPVEAAANDIRPAPLTEPAPLAAPPAAAETTEPRRPVGSFRLGGRPVQLSDEPESASA